MLTQEDYKKIEKYLQSKVQKDSEFNDAEMPLAGNELVTLVQKGSNKKLFIKDFVNQIFSLGIPDFINISDKYKETCLTLGDAIALVPTKLRKVGQVITFTDTNNTWKVYQFKGGSLNQWNNLSLWLDITSSLGDILPDEEDLTKTVNDESPVIKLKDKDYSPSDYSGLGRVYLRKNIQNGKNILTQNMIYKPNTIYIIQYNYDLDNATISIPDGCILKFEGGSISNGRLKGKNTIIESSIVNIFRNITFSGIWCIKDLNPEWFYEKDKPEIDNVNSRFGTTPLRPILSVSYAGYAYFDLTLNKPIWWDGYKWIDAVGNTV